ncbi:MAG: nickel pincer cofactor biosynthesis protein LarC [Actinomycetota bacterium]|nr:nickel pincer cofactor biosynthesis protein LarC [Actinomycetota bacterium]
MKIAYFDCFSGISGDMVLGALVDLGLDVQELREVLSRLDLENFEIEEKEVLSYGLRATKVNVICEESRLVRTFNNIRELIVSSELPERVKEVTLEIFMRIARAESLIHGKPIDQVHFHEVGSVDSIVDIVGSAYGIHSLGIDVVYSSPLPMGHGMVKTLHGSIPVPAPAVLEILEGTPTYGRGIPTEIVTPTGASIIKTLAISFGDSPPMRISKVGYGAGSKDIGVPNLLRVITGDSIEAQVEGEEIASLISTNIDDMNPEFYDYVIERLLTAGAQDAWLVPIQMKKTRPGIVVSVLCSPADAAKIKGILLEETSTFGLRTATVMKKAIERDVLEVSTEWGKVRVKVGRESGNITNISPEFADCAKIAEARGIPIKNVFRKAQLLAQQKIEENEGRKPEK